MVSAAFTALLTHTFTVSRRLRVSDGQGGWAEAWEEVITTVQGRLRPASASERTVADQQQARVTHVLYTAAGVDIMRGDLVEGAGTAVEVLAVREPSYADHHYEIDCRQTQQEGSVEAAS